MQRCPDKETPPPASYRLHPAAWLPIPALFTLIVALWAADLHTSYESHYLRGSLNFIFLTLVSLFVAVLVTRSFLASAKPGLLLLACGALFWGMAGASGSLVFLPGAYGVHFDANVQITMFNTLAWLSACCHLAGAALSIRWSRLAVRRPRRLAAGAATAVLAIGGFIVLAALSRWTSPFFIAGTGTTPVRQLVLWAAIAMFVLTAALLREQHRSRMSPFVAWYSLGLLLLALALAGLALMPFFGSAVGWVSRATQYLGGCYMLVAAFHATRSSGDMGITLRPVRQRALHTYGIAVTLAVAAAIIRLVFMPILGSDYLHVMFFPAVMLAALYAGFRAGVLAAVTSIVLEIYFWIEPLGSLRVDDTEDVPGIAIFFLGAVMIARIVESMHRALEKMQQHEVELEERVIARTQEIAALNTQLLARTRDAEAASRAKSAFLSTMSHEIRTPLTAVVGLTSLLSQSACDRRQRDYADKLQLSAQALRMLIDDILDYSKIEAGALLLEQAPFSLNAILRTTATIVSTGLRDKPVEVLFDVDWNLPDALVGDSLRLQQILLNLTSNAVKFTEAGEIVVSVRCLGEESGKVTLQFAVRDTGIGIPSSELGRIFDVFAQANFSISRRYGGTGLGLAISARLAELMGSRIMVESTPGAGSEFRFVLTLPVAAPQRAGIMPDALSDLNILIVDDHPLARDILARTCAAFGWRSHAAESGAAGLEELRRSTAEGRDYDLMLLDWRMPGMDGIDMLRQAYATKGIGLPLVVLMTPSFELEQAIAASDDLYLDGIVAKPITPAGLLGAVKQAYSGDFAEILPLPDKTDRRLAGLRLLVAEDNAINQQVIEQVLTGAGATAVIAANGLAAIEALQAPGARFDAVLMDLQMPIMDGHTAAKTIRTQMGLADLPVIAVTAYSGPEDRTESSMAGMTAHLVKPIDIDDLLDVLNTRRHDLASPGAAGTGAVTDRPAPTEPLPIIDTAAAVKIFGDDLEKHVELLHRFVLIHGSDPDKARGMIDTGDINGAARLIHGLRGTASLVRATQLAQTASTVSHALRDNPAADVSHLLDELQTAMHALRKATKAFNAGTTAV